LSNSMKISSKAIHMPILRERTDWCMMFILAKTCPFIGLL